MDGVTGTAILWGLLTLLDASVEYYVPHRLEEGYGLNVEALRTLAKKGVQMVVTVDCGIASIVEAEEARRIGLELIITDHHEMKATLPPADVLVHPRLPGELLSPLAGLSGSRCRFQVGMGAGHQNQRQRQRVSPRLRVFCWTLSPWPLLVWSPTSCLFTMRTAFTFGRVWLDFGRSRLSE